MQPDAKTIRKDTLDRADEIIERLSSEAMAADLFTTEFKDRFIEDVRASDAFMRSQTPQEAAEAIQAVFERTMTLMQVDDRIKAPIRSAFALRLHSAS